MKYVTGKPGRNVNAQDEGGVDTDQLRLNANTRLIQNGAPDLLQIVRTLRRNTFYLAWLVVCDAQHQHSAAFVPYRNGVFADLIATQQSGFEFKVLPFLIFNELSKALYGQLYV